MKERRALQSIEEVAGRALGRELSESIEEVTLVEETVTLDGARISKSANVRTRAPVRSRGPFSVVFSEDGYLWIQLWVRPRAVALAAAITGGAFLTLLALLGLVDRDTVAAIIDVLRNT